ncbi:MAG TPA: SulP family inorganic anion transporter [Solirubrobacteraceae bacterium]
MTALRALWPPGRPPTSDLIAGLSVALVLIPQSLAYAELAGMPPERGLYAAAIPLLVAAPLASSPYLQTGPVAVTALLTFGALSTIAVPGSDAYVALGLALALIVGIVRLAAGLLRAGTIAYLLSQPMLLGFVPAAALLILASQLPGAVGAAAPDPGVLDGAVWALAHPGQWEPTAVLLSLATIALVLGGRRLHTLFPGVLVAVVGAIGLAELIGYDGRLIGTIPIALPPLSADLPWDRLPELLLPGVIIALVGFAEPASIARYFAALDRARWSANREFVSQGAANVAAAFTGGFPVGGSFSRSSLNHLAGGRTRWAGAITGLVVLAALPLVGVLEGLPRAVLAAIVIASVIPLLRLVPIARLWAPSRPAFVVAASTFAVTILSSPHVERGVLVGVGMSLALHLWREMRVDVDDSLDDGILHVRPRGVLWFVSAPALGDRLRDQLAAAPEARGLCLHLDAIGRLDITAAVALRALVDECASAGLDVEIRGVQERDRRLIDGVVWSATPFGP